MTTDKINQVVDDSMTSPFCLVGSIVFIRQAYEYVVVDVDVREETSIANDRIYIYVRQTLFVRGRLRYTGSPSQYTNHHHDDDLHGPSLPTIVSANAV